MHLSGGEEREFLPGTSELPFPGKFKNGTAVFYQLYKDQLCGKNVYFGFSYGICARIY